MNRRSDDDFREEMEFHIEKRAEANIANGMSTSDAREAARRQFGNRGMISEDVHRVHVSAFIETFLQDTRYAVRSFRKNPGFALWAILAIALGIGATTAVFSVVDLILFRSLPYTDDARLVSVGITVPRAGNVWGGYEWLFGGAYVQWRDRQTAFSSFTSWSGASHCDLTQEGSPVRLSCAAVASSFLPTLGITPMIGRNFTREEDILNGPKVALLSYDVWKNRYGSDALIVGRTIPIDDDPVRIVGVLPSSFELPTLDHFDLLVPQQLAESRWRTLDSGRQVWAFARLDPGEDVNQAHAKLQPLLNDFLAAAPPAFRKDIQLTVRSLRDRQVGGVRTISLILFGAVFAVLLIACCNVGNLLLARAAARRHELAVRSAIGAGRTRLIRQALTESALLGLAGGAAGCSLSVILLETFIRIAPEGIARLQQAKLDLRVLVFTAIVSVFAGVAFGIFPALQPTEAQSILGVRNSGASAGWARRLLIVSQIAVSIVLLSGAGLLLRTLWNAQRVGLGIHPDGVYVAKVELGQQRYGQLAKQAAFFRALRDRIQNTLGVSSFTISDSAPPDTTGRSAPFAAGWRVVGQPTLSDDTEGTGGRVAWRAVSGDYFGTLGIPILRGHDFRDPAVAGVSNPIILSREFASRLFGDQDPIGKELETGSEHATRFIVIGVAADVRNTPVTQANDPEYYVMADISGIPPTPYGLFGFLTRSAVLTVRSPLPQAVIANQMLAQVAAIDKTLPVEVHPLTEQVAGLTVQQRFNATVLGIFAGLGLFLAAIGLYGVISFLVTQRTQEIGIRMAMGATGGDVLQLVILGALRWALVGIALGLAFAAAATRLLGSMLFGVKANDPWSLSAAVAILFMAACAAAWIPARRATRIDPLQALRHE